MRHDSAALGVVLSAGPVSGGEALPAPVAGAHCKSGGLGLGETLAVDKATHTVIGVREIWSRGQHVTFTSAGGWKAADPTVPMAYLYKPAFSR